MNISENGIALIKSFEGLKLEAYKDSANIPTIGYGTIKYPDGKDVEMGDTCTEQEAEEYLLFEINQKASGINQLKWDVPLTQNQYDSICSFTYNLGLGALKVSTLYKKASVNPNDESIYKYDVNNPAETCEFTKWITAGGKVVKGLLNRRIKEADLYEDKDLRETIIRLIDDCFDDKTELERVLNNTTVTPDSIALREKAKDIIKDIPDKESAIELLNLYL